MNLNEIQEKLKEISDRESWLDDDDFTANVCAGGNIGDAFWGGYNAGQIAVARELSKDNEGDSKNELINT